MFWSKKDKKEGLPDLPPSPMQSFKRQPQSSVFPSKPEIFRDEDDETDDLNTSEKHTLPSFPDSALNKGFSQAAIKDAVTTKTDDLGLKEIPNSNDNKFKTIELDEDEHLVPIGSIKEMEKIHKSIHSAIPTIIEPHQWGQKREEKLEIPNISQKAEDSRSNIFVKIDKFRSARKSLEEIHTSVEEISELLKRIRETKLREEQELSAWEKEVTTIKSRLQSVTENIFEKIE